MTRWDIDEIKEIDGKKYKLIKTERLQGCDNCVHDTDLDPCIGTIFEEICSYYEDENPISRKNESFSIIFKEE